MPNANPFDVNAARTVRQMTTGAAWEFRVDGETFTLPRELSRATSAALRRLDDSDVDGLLTLLLGEEQFDRLEQHELTMTDVAAVLEAYTEETGVVGPGA